MFVSAEEPGVRLTMDSTLYSVGSMGMMTAVNFSDQPLYLKGCTNVFPSYTVQKRKEDGTYENIYSPTCSPRPPAPRKIDVESALQAQLRVIFDVGRGGPTAGTYRIRLSLHRDAAATTPALEESVSVTKPFFVR